MMTDEIASRVLKSLSNHIWKMCEILFFILFFNTLRISQDKKTKKAVNMIEL